MSWDEGGCRCDGSYSAPITGRLNDGSLPSKPGRPWLLCETGPPRIPP
jgi:hypothetical protein